MARLPAALGAAAGRRSFAGTALRWPVLDGDYIGRERRAR